MVRACQEGFGCFPLFLYPSDGYQPKIISTYTGSVVVKNVIIASNFSVLYSPLNIMFKAHIHKANTVSGLWWWAAFDNLEKYCWETIYLHPCMFIYYYKLFYLAHFLHVNCSQLRLSHKNLKLLQLQIPLVTLSICFSQSQTGILISLREHGRWCSVSLLHFIFPPPPPPKKKKAPKQGHWQPFLHIIIIPMVWTWIINHGP